MEGNTPWLELLLGISGAFRPKVLTCLMGVTGAGKTTLMDVLAGRKTGMIGFRVPLSQQHLVLVADIGTTCVACIVRRSCSMIEQSICINSGYELLSLSVQRVLS